MIKIYHPETGASTEIPDDKGTLSVLEKAGWTTKEPKGQQTPTEKKEG